MELKSGRFNRRYAKKMIGLWTRINLTRPNWATMFIKINVHLSMQVNMQENVLIPTSWQTL